MSVDFAVETEIGSPVSTVFAYVTDPSKLATWQTNTVSVVQDGVGRLGLGTRLHEVHRAPGGKEIRSLVEVSEYQPDEVFALHTLEGALAIDARITFESTERGTRLRFAASGQAAGPLRLLQPLLSRTLRRQFARYCATLKNVLENALRTPSPE
jgi:uncharacterized protein YndB with AHSA1/START domain